MTEIPKFTAARLLDVGLIMNVVALILASIEVVCLRVRLRHAEREPSALPYITKQYANVPSAMAVIREKLAFSSVAEVTPIVPQTRLVLIEDVKIPVHSILAQDKRNATFIIMLSSVYVP